MDWDLKMPPWDLAELARDAEPDLGSMVSSGSGGVAHQASASDCSVDLKLGGFGDLGLSSKWKDQMRVSLSMVPPSGSAAAAASSSGSSKRARTPGNGVQNASCLVDGCTSDLSNCRDYHRRHKVCEVHSKTPVVMVNGQQQRFCQQCSRFHSLVEFDEVKRSCRKRLDGHNRRRRKPQPDTVNMGSLFANHQAAGPRFSSYSQMLPSATLEPNWAAAVRSEAAGLCGQQNPLCFIDGREQFPVPSSPSFPQGYREGKLFSFLQEGGGSAFSTRTLEAAPVIRSQAFGSAESSKGKMFAGDGLPRVPDSDCALSLLSSPTQTSGGISFGPILPAAERIIPVGQPLASAMHQYGGLGHYSPSPAASSDISPAGFSRAAAAEAEDARAAAAVMISDAGDAGLHYQGIFHDGTSDGASSSSSQAIPFSWQ